MIWRIGFELLVIEHVFPGLAESIAEHVEIPGLTEAIGVPGQLGSKAGAPGRVDE